MIDGTPDDVTPNIATYDVTNTLSNVTTSNDTATAMEYQPYEADITVPFGYAIDSIKVMMGGKDVTAQVFSGVATNLRRAVKVTATNCMVSGKKAVIDRQDFVATVTADFGYTVDTVKIMMGGVDVSTFYSGGKIAIPNVTGDIEIVATAVESAVAYTNLAAPDSADWYADSRIKSDCSIVSADGYTVSNKIYCKAGDVLRVYGINFTAKGRSDSQGGCKIASYNETTETKIVWMTNTKYGDGYTYGIYEQVTQNGDMFEYVVGTKGDGVVTTNPIEYIRISGFPTVDKNKIIITINEPIE